MSPNLDLSAQPALAKRVRLQSDPVSGDPVLLYPEGLLILNETAHAIVRRCNGLATIVDILGQLADEYGAEVDELRPDVLECLHDLHQRQLVTF
ncbi:MAG TPA: pyrroloquinoline quinone biosynthesis peptide chaperone PqqD [Chthoniobacterales bacterium]